MLPRRRFLALAPAAAGLPLAAADADESRARAARPQSAASVPPSIAALASMRQLATPITNDERLGRIERARALMARHRLDAIAMAGGTSLVYFSNVRLGEQRTTLPDGPPGEGGAVLRLPGVRGGPRPGTDRGRDRSAARPTSAPGRRTKTPMRWWRPA